MKNQDQPAYPQIDTGDKWIEGGLTKRELFAAIEQLNDMDSEATSCCDAYKSNLVGRPCPKWNQANAIEREMFEAEFRAKVRVIRADALLAELNKENVCEWKWDTEAKVYRLDGRACTTNWTNCSPINFCPYCGRKIKEVK